MKIFSPSILLSAIILLECQIPSAALAVDLSESVQLHGYGHIGALSTDSNSYLEADNGVTWDYKDIALLFAGKINDRSNAWVQFYGINGKGRVDWAFIDYQVASGPIFRIGQMKMPIGLYNEIRDIEFMRPSSIKPFLYHESTEITEEAYRGAGLTYVHDLAGGSLTWDAYGGNAVEFETPLEHSHKRIKGGRVAYQTPIEGLTVMYSAFNNDLYDLIENVESIKRSSVISLDYNVEPLDLKTEFGKESAFGKTLETWYVQAAYAIDDYWKPYLRYDYITTDIDKSDDPSFFQYSKVVGIGYTFNKNLGLRAEIHFNHGYAMPVYSESMVEGSGVTDWQMSAVSLNFNF